MPLYLLVIPTVLVGLLGLVFLYIPKQLPFQRRVIARLGEGKLVQSLEELKLVCVCTVGPLMLVYLWHTGPTFDWKDCVAWACVMGALLLGIRPEPSMSSAQAKRWGATVFPWMMPADPSIYHRQMAGICLFTLALALGVLIKTDIPWLIATAGLVLTLALAYVTVRTAMLGSQAGARTPWPALAVLCAMSLVGTLLSSL